MRFGPGSIWSRYRSWYQVRWLRFILPRLDVSRADEQIIAARACRAIASRRWYGWYLFLIVCLALLLTVGLSFLVPRLACWTLLILPLPLAAAFNIVCMRWPRGACREAVREVLCDHGMDLCLRCGQIIDTAVASDCCPECATPRGRR